ncbi:protein of unknown function [Burkholderia multivorans]
MGFMRSIHIGGVERHGEQRTVAAHRDVKRTLRPVEPQRVHGFQREWLAVERNPHGARRAIQQHRVGPRDAMRAGAPHGQRAARRAAARHQVEVARRAVMQRRGDRRFAGEIRTRERRVEHVARAARFGQRHARARQQHQRAVDAFEARERAGLRDVRDAHPPRERVERAARRMSRGARRRHACGDLARHAAAVLPRRCDEIGRANQRRTHAAGELRGHRSATEHRQLEAGFTSRLLREFVAGIRVTHHAGGRIVEQHAAETFVRISGAVGDDHDARVLRKAHADAAAVVQRHPRCAARGVQQRVEQRPVADRIRAVLHRFGLAVRARDRASVEVIAADHDRRLQLAVLHHLVERLAQAIAILHADPADARRQPLERDALARHVEPVVQVRIVRDQFLDLLVGLVDILRIAGQRDPAERPLPFAEQRTDVRRHEAREVERVLDAHLERHLADVVAVVERRRAAFLQRQHRAHLHRHRLLRGLHDALRIDLLRFAPLRDGPALRQVAVDRVVRARLVGHAVRRDAARDDFREHVGCVPEQADRHRLAAALRVFDHRERFVERRRLLVDVAGLQAEVDARLVALDRDHREAGHRRRQRLRAAHAAKTARQDPAARRIAVEVLVRDREEGFVGSLHDALAADVDPAAGRHLAVHHQALAVELVEVVPGRPVRHQVRVRDQHARCILVRAEHADRLARLHEQRLVLVQILQRREDLVVAIPVARRAADAAVYDKCVRVLGDFRVQVVLDHPVRRLGEPGLAGLLAAARRVDRARGIETGIDMFRMVHDDCSRRKVKINTDSEMPGEAITAAGMPQIRHRGDDALRPGAPM